MRILKGFGKFLVFALLNGLGGAIAATIMTNMIVDNFAWILGQPKTGSAYGNVVAVISWGLWGLVGALVAVEGYSKIFKQFPPRWMGITTVSIVLFSWILTTLGIIVLPFLAEEIELERWKDFAHLTASIVTFWYLFGLPPLSRHNTPVAMSAGRYQSSNEERIQQEAANEAKEAKERLRIYNENYRREEKALRKRVLDDLKAIARGEKRCVDPETVEAAKKIMERQGVNNPGMAESHPEIVKPWATLINDLSAGTLEDAKAIQDRLADLLYPETLEDVEALESLRDEGVTMLSLGKKMNPEHLDACKALNEIRERVMRRRREEEEAQKRERALRRKQDEEHVRWMEEMMKSSARNIARIRLLRLSHKFAHLPTEEAEARIKEELERELDQERQERARSLDKLDREQDQERRARARTLEERQERRRRTE